MAIQDILTPVDIVPGFGSPSRSDAIPPGQDSPNTQSEYQRALSRTLSDEGRQDQRTGTETNSAVDRNPEAKANTENHRATTESDQQTVDSKQEVSRSTAQTENDSKGVVDSEDFQDATPAEVRDAGVESGPIDSDEATELLTEAAVVAAVLPVPIIVAAMEEPPPKPPAEISALFVAAGEGDLAIAEVPLGDQIEPDETIPRPPSGLFESLIEAPTVQQQESVVVPAVQPSTASISALGPIDGSVEVDVVPPQLTEGQNEQQVINQIPLEADDAILLSEISETQNAPIEVKPVEVEPVEVPRVGIQAQPESPLPQQAETIEVTTEEKAVKQPISQVIDARNSGVQVDSSESALTTVESGETRNLETNLRAETPASVPAEHQDHQSDETVKSLGTNPVVQTVENPTPADITSRTDVQTRTESSSNGELPLSSQTVTPTNVSSTTGVASDTPPIENSNVGMPKVDPEQVIARAASAIQAAPQNGQQLRVRLYPPHLGALQVEVTSNGGSVTVRMEVQTVNAQNALFDNMSLLREALVSQGTVVDRIDVQLVEAAPEDGESNLTDEQQQEQMKEQNTEEQASQDDDESPTTEETEQGRKPVAGNASMDEIDIQV